MKIIQMGMFNAPEEQEIARFIEAIGLFAANSSLDFPLVDDVAAPYRRDGCREAWDQTDMSGGSLAFATDSDKFTEVSFSVIREWGGEPCGPEVYVMRMGFNYLEAGKPALLRDLVPFLGPWRRYPEPGVPAMRGVAHFHDPQAFCGTPWAHVWLLTDVHGSDALDEQAVADELCVSRILEDGKGNRGLSYGRSEDLHCPELPGR